MCVCVYVCDKKKKDIERVNNNKRVCGEMCVV